jgi:hypothetical protein
MTRTVADTSGHFILSADNWPLVELYRFGSRTADYMVCRHCGVYVTAICETAAGTRAFVSINCLDDRAAFTQPPNATNYDGETEPMRLSHGAINWMPATVER